MKRESKRRTRQAVKKTPAESGLGGEAPNASRPYVHETQEDRERAFFAMQVMAQYRTAPAELHAPLHKDLPQTERVEVMQALAQHRRTPADLHLSVQHGLPMMEGIEAEPHRGEEDRIINEIQERGDSMKQDHRDQDEASFSPPEESGVEEFTGEEYPAEAHPPVAEAEEEEVVAEAASEETTMYSATFREAEAAQPSGDEGARETEIEREAVERERVETPPEPVMETVRAVEPEEEAARFRPREVPAARPEERARAEEPLSALAKEMRAQKLSGDSRPEGEEYEDSADVVPDGETGEPYAREGKENRMVRVPVEDLGEALGRLLRGVGDGVAKTGVGLVNCVGIAANTAAKVTAELINRIAAATAPASMESVAAGEKQGAPEPAEAGGAAETTAGNRSGEGESS